MGNSNTIHSVNVLYIDNIVHICYISTMSNDESKNERFKRLAKQRGDRILKDIALLGNLSNKNNYSYSDAEVNKFFAAIETELRIAKMRFTTTKKREINF